MKVRRCPRCHQDLLVSTGSFWDCHGCRYVITSAALTVDLAGSLGPAHTTGRSGRRK